MGRCVELEVALKASFARELECRTAVFFKELPPNRSNTLAAYETPLVSTTDSELHTTDLNTFERRVLTILNPPRSSLRIAEHCWSYSALWLDILVALEGT